MAEGDRVLDEAALEKIASAVAEAERGTAGEIVVVAARRSDAWVGARTALGLAAGSIGTVTVSALAPWVHGMWLGALFPLLFVLGFLVAGLPFVLRALLTDDAIDEAVLRAAKVAFVDHGVHRTVDRAGVLVYISAAERRVQLLGDAGVHKVVGDDGWRRYAQQVVRGLKGHDADELVRVVKDIGGVLASSFPPRAENPDELPNAVRVS